MRTGSTVEGAVRACGVAPSSHYEWMQRHDDYREAIVLARAEAEANPVATVTLAAREDWRAEAWFLEREHPTGGADDDTGEPMTAYEQAGATTHTHDQQRARFTTYADARAGTPEESEPRA
ncbi:hypothetical protein [Candidatus Solirubrobacter pratensis]|uniref:hypothetical protein n=1 Tax=Candidatus Solirubrobacter pratensis TaxID=1298857 RepID=UPI0004006C34|nr:hypothetical protein [Candidatus Solirubrobacter pratensis]